MADDALIAWLDAGAKVELTAEESAARLHQDFAALFRAALNPSGDLGTTEESHQLEVARNVLEVHQSLNAKDQTFYDAVWLLLDAPTRASIKTYITMAKRDPR